MARVGTFIHSRLSSIRKALVAISSNVFLNIFIVCLVYSLLALSTGWNNPLLDQHPFRQTQTAISVYYMLKGSSWIAYETPVLGAPWSIPFEFPGYQWIVATLVKFSNIPLDQAGRFVSACFFYLSLIPIYIILSCLNIQKRYRWIFLSLLVTSPLYIFWSRTFMIESTALFFSLAYLAAVGSYSQQKKAVYVLFAIFFGVLGAVVKITTFASFLLAAILFTLHAWYKSQKNRADIILALAIPAITFVLIPYIAFSAWTHFADAHKQLNPIASGFITSSALTTWNFGTLQQRFSLAFLRPFKRVLLGDLPVSSPAILFLIPWLFFGQYRELAITSLFLFLFPILTFANLHIIHGYYQYANGIFLVSAIGFCLLNLLEREDTKKNLGFATLILCLLLQVKLNWVQETEIKEKPLLETADIIRKSTSPDDVSIIYGYDWSPALPYYSQRRALMFFGMHLPSEPKLKSALKNLSKYRVGAIVACLEKMESKEIVAFITAYHFQSTAAFSNSECRVYLPLPK
jgi:hypothetical protein